MADGLSAARHAWLRNPGRRGARILRLVHRVNVDTLSNIEVVTNARRPLLAYAALVLEYIIRIGKRENVAHLQPSFYVLLSGHA